MLTGGQIYYRIAKSLGYDVQFVHVKCKVSGTGHIRLRLRHKKHTSGNWINRDPAAVADTTSGNVRAIWCEDGYLIAYDPPGYSPICIAVNVNINFFSFFALISSIHYNFTI